MHTNTKKIIKVMETIAPPQLKEAWDNVGLMVGYPNKMIENVMVTLEVTESVIDEAIEKNVDMIIAHHPLIYRAMEKIVESDPIGHMLLRLIKNDINLYVAHTNLDAASKGTCHHVAELMGLSRIEYIHPTVFDKLYKIECTVPTNHAERLKDALTKAGAGTFGEYTECLFSLQGKSQFKPSLNANPTIGELGELTHVDELKIETSATKAQLDHVIDQLLKHHPYEVPNYAVFELKNDFNGQGVGMYGYLEKSVSLEDLTKQVKKKLNCDSIKFVGNKAKKVNRVAVITGAGADYYNEVKKVADVLITGDTKYHEAQYALQLGLHVIDAGHFETEQIYTTKLKSILETAFEDKSYDVKVLLSETDINPFQTI